VATTEIKPFFFFFISLKALTYQLQIGEQQAEADQNLPFCIDSDWQMQQQNRKGRKKIPMTANKTETEIEIDATKTL